MNEQGASTQPQSRAAEPARRENHGGTTDVIEINHLQCVFDDCREDADGSLQACWPDGQIWRREVCLVHIARGIKSLEEFRGPDAGEPIITRVRWRVSSMGTGSDQLTMTDYGRTVRVGLLVPDLIAVATALKSR